MSHQHEEGPAFGGEAMALAQALRNTPFVALPETEKEVKALSTEVYAPRASLIRVRAAAREETVKAEMDRYRVLHFATHAVLDDKNQRLCLSAGVLDGPVLRLPRRYTEISGSN